jgi:hypothetical protein
MSKVTEFYCRYCEYTTDKPSDWLKHVATQKHKRFGEKKTHTCNEDDCNYECRTAWNMKLHMLSKHSSKEERTKQKYYCSDCDTVFFSHLYMDTHMKGIKHKNYVDAVEELNKIKDNKKIKK